MHITTFSLKAVLLAGALATLALRAQCAEFIYQGHLTDYGDTDYAGSHRHSWIWKQNNDAYGSWRADGSSTLMSYFGDDGIGYEGSGYYPLCDNTSPQTRNWYTEITGSHAHSYSPSHDHPESISAGAVGPHIHSVDLPSLGTLNRASTSVSHLPPYYGLLKIMCVK